MVATFHSWGAQPRKRQALLIAWYVGQIESSYWPRGVGREILLSTNSAGEWKMRILGSNHVHSPQSVNPPHGLRQAKGITSTQSTSQVAGDRLDISAAAEAAAQASEDGGIRTELVASIKQQIADGSYETAEKIDAALDRLLDELA